MCYQVDCGGGQHARVPRGGWHHHWDCCCAPGYAQRRFPTREEVIEELEEYLKQLRAETKGVEERIAELRKEG
jgi:hypothetical protein